jgi:hypothetical protein
MSKRQRLITKRGDLDLISVIDAHVAHHLGEVSTIYHDTASSETHVDVFHVLPTRTRRFASLITCGMSGNTLQDPAFALELCMCLPHDWKSGANALSDRVSSWPIELLRQFAKMTTESGILFGPGHTNANGDPPKPYADNTRLCAAVLYPPVAFPRGFWETKHPDGQTILFLTVVPIYSEELELCIKAGPEELYGRLEKIQNFWIVDVKRRNVA